MKNVAILGASNKKDRYSNKAQAILVKKGYKVYPINPKLDKIDNIKCYKSLEELDVKIDTLTLYINPKILLKYTDSILKLKPLRVIFNPGTESDEIENLFKENSISVIKACTLIMLSTNQF